MNRLTINHSDATVSQRIGVGAAGELMLMNGQSSSKSSEGDGPAKGSVLLPCQAT